MFNQTIEHEVNYQCMRLVLKKPSVDLLTHRLCGVVIYVAANIGGKYSAIL